MVGVKKDNKDPQQRFLAFVRLKRTQMVLAACAAVILMHFVILWAHHDDSLGGKTHQWLVKHGIRSMKEKGGVVVFLQRPRTGGKSVKANLNKHDFGVVMTHPHAEASYSRAKVTVEQVLRGNVTEDLTQDEDPRIHFLALHEDFASIPKIRNDIEHWRALAKKHRTALFVFTLVRNPVDYHISWFNEYRVSPCIHPSCVQPLLEPTDANLLSDVKANAQCRGFSKLPDDLDSPVTAEDCNSAYEWMTKNLDWIGTTDNLSTETLPLLAELILGDAERAESMRITGDQTKTLILRSNVVAAGAARKVRSRSALDQKLYDQVKYDYYL